MADKKSTTTSKDNQKNSCSCCGSNHDRGSSTSTSILRRLARKMALKVTPLLFAALACMPTACSSASSVVKTSAEMNAMHSTDEVGTATPT